MYPGGTNTKLVQPAENKPAKVPKSGAGGNQTRQNSAYNRNSHVCPGPLSIFLQCLPWNSLWRAGIMTGSRQVNVQPSKFAILTLTRHCKTDESKSKVSTLISSIWGRKPNCLKKLPYWYARLCALKGWRDVSNMRLRKVFPAYKLP